MQARGGRMLFALLGRDGGALGSEGCGWGAVDFEAARGVVQIEDAPQPSSAIMRMD